jgi:hypothetical protein
MHIKKKICAILGNFQYSLFHPHHYHRHHCCYDYHVVIVTSTVVISAIKIIINPFIASCENAMTPSVPGVPESCEKFPHSSQLNF